MVRMSRCGRDNPGSTPGVVSILSKPGTLGLITSQPSVPRSRSSRAAALFWDDLWLQAAPVTTSSSGWDVALWPRQPRFDSWCGHIDIPPPQPLVEKILLYLSTNQAWICLSASDRVSEQEMDLKSLRPLGGPMSSLWQFTMGSREKGGAALFLQSAN